MGAKTWMLVYSETSAREALKNAPQLDRDATTRLAQDLFPDETLEPLAAEPPRSTPCIALWTGSHLPLAKWNTDSIAQFVSG